MTHPSLNVYNAPELGTQQMEEFERGLPGSFHETIHRHVTTMAVSQKHIQVSDMNMFDTQMTYARAMALQCSQQNYDTKNLMAHEPSARPASMFDDSGAMQVAETKNDLKVEVARRHVAVDASFLDGCAMLWVVPWPNGGNVQDFLNKFRRHIQGHLESSDVYLIFDRYTAGSIKESTRNDRDQGASRVYELRLLARLPAQKIVLTASRNKTQLVDLIMEDLQAHKDVLNGKLVITGNDPVPVQINEGVVSKMEGMTITHEEADTMIIHCLCGCQQCPRCS